MTKLELLRAVRAQIDTPEKWTQNTSARDAFGCPASPYSALAASWCLFGAACAVMNRMRDFSHEIISTDLINFNDDLTTTHADVMARLDALIDDEVIWEVDVLRGVHDVCDVDA